MVVRQHSQPQADDAAQRQDQFRAGVPTPHQGSRELQSRLRPPAENETVLFTLCGR